MPTGGKRKKGDRVMRKTLPMNLQFFAEGGDGNGDQNAGSNNNGQAGQQSGQNNQQTAGVDYDKIQAMLDNATAKKENAVLKSYFQQQGLSEDEISQAIATFKQNKQQQTEQQQNANANLQNEVAAAQKVAEQAQIELAATKVAMTLGIEAKTLNWGILKEDEMALIKNKLIAGFFPITFHDDGQDITITSYRGTLSKEVLGDIGDGNYYYRSASVSIIQQ
jgi:hypothetical protein